jgi:hypothetical protein
MRTSEQCGQKVSDGCRCLVDVSRRESQRPFHLYSPQRPPLARMPPKKKEEVHAQLGAPRDTQHDRVYQQLSQGISTHSLGVCVWRAHSGGDQAHPG